MFQCIFACDKNFLSTELIRIDIFNWIIALSNFKGAQDISGAETVSSLGLLLLVKTFFIPKYSISDLVPYPPFKYRYYEEGAGPWGEMEFIHNMVLVRKNRIKKGIYWKKNIYWEKNIYGLTQRYLELENSPSNHIFRDLIFFTILEPIGPILSYIPQPYFLTIMEPTHFIWVW